jgi:hypothetical protein
MLTRSRDAFAPECCGKAALKESKRAQGMPGDGLTHGPPANKKAGGSDHRLSRINPAFPAQWCYGLYAFSPVSGLDSHRRRRIIIRQLDPSVGRSGPRDFAVRVRHVRPTWHPRPSHPRPTVRDDRPKRPSSSRQDARNAAGDLPDEASVSACDRLARRAKWAWGVCGIWRSGAGVRARMYL